MEERYRRFNGDSFHTSAAEPPGTADSLRAQHRDGHKRSTLANEPTLERVDTYDVRRNGGWR
jgi:hypothetical protein